MEEKRYHEALQELAQGYGAGSQEGVKEALSMTQDREGCVSAAHQEAIAAAFGVPTTIVSTLMRFNKKLSASPLAYDVICCSGPRCAKRGSLEVLKTVSQGLSIDFGETTPDGRIRLRTQNCFKECHRGPNIMVNGRFYHEMDVDKARALLSELKAK